MDKMYARAQAAAASRPRRAASLRAEPPRTTHVRRDAAARAHSSISACDYTCLFT